MSFSRRLITLCVLSCIFLSFRSFGDENNSMELLEENVTDKELFINNKVLFRVKDHVITVMDVIQKLDLLFYRHYPHLKKSISSKVQFYQGYWTAFVESVIEEFLISIDAEEKKIYVDSTEVKKEIEKSFGKDMVVVTSAFNIKEEDIFNIVRREMLVQKMLGIMVQSKASLSVSPNKIKEAYKESVQKHVPKKHWSYIILTLQSTSLDNAVDLANEIHDRIIFEKAFKESDIVYLAEKNNIKIKISNVLQGTPDTLSKIHQQILNDASKNLCSRPLPHNKDQIRLFVIKEFSVTKPLAFHEVEDQLHNELLAKAVNEQEIIYKNKLKERYSFSKDKIPQELVSGDSLSHLFSWLS